MKGIFRAKTNEGKTEAETTRIMHSDMATEQHLKMVYLCKLDIGAHGFENENHFVIIGH